VDPVSSICSDGGHRPGFAVLIDDRGEAFEWILDQGKVLDQLGLFVLQRHTKSVMEPKLGSKRRL